MKAYFFSTTGLAGLLCAGLAGYATPVQAQAANAEAGVIEEIVVTARRKAENLQSVPVAVTAISPQDLSSKGTVGYGDLAQSVPSLNFANFAQSRSDINPTIRGQNTVFGGRYPSVIAYFAEVPILKITQGQFYDLEGLQILRGPQGTLFGRVTDGGNILISPSRPDSEFGGYIEAKAGNYDMRGLTGAVNVPLIQDKLIVRAAFDINRRDGFTKNVLPGVAKKYRDLDNVHYDSFRVSVLAKPTENLENLTVYSYNQADENGTGNVTTGVNPGFLTFALGPVLGPLVAAQAQDALLAQQARGVRTTSVGDLTFGPNAGLFNKRHDTYVINTTTWRPGENFQVKNIFGYVRIKNRFGTDNDGSPVNLVLFPNPIYPSPDFNLEQFSDELQIQGRIGGKLDYTLGTYWDRARTGGRSENTSMFFLFAYAAQNQYAVSDSRAVYGQVSYDLGDLVTGLKLDAGLRYTEDHTKASSASISGLWDPHNILGFGVFDLSSYPHGICPDSPSCVVHEVKSHAITYTAGLNYQITNDIMIYGKVSRGYRPGGINIAPDPTKSPLYFPEYDLSKELGAKADYDIGFVHARTNIAVFHDNYQKIQKLVTEIPFVRVLNANKAKVWGIELDQTIVPMRGLNINVSYSHLEAEYDQPSAAEVTAACTPPYSGFCTLNRFSGAPSDAVTVNAHYTLPLSDDIGEITFGGSWYHRSSMASNDNSFIEPSAISPGYDLISLDVRWSNIFRSKVDAALFVTNVTDKVYSSGLNGALNTLGFSSAQYGAPRMWGLSMRYNFGGN